MFLIKKFGRGLLICIVSLLTLTFLLTIFNYIGLIKYNAVNIIEIIIIFISIFIGSFYIGKNSSQKGWIEGIKFGIIFLLVLLLFNYLGFNIKFKLKNLIYYLIILSSSILGSMIGISKKNKP